MALGLPVIAANSSCLPEIYQDAAIYFDPHSPDDLAAKISQLQSDPALGKKMILLGLKQAKKYSWAKMSKQTWEIYQHALH